MTIQSSSLRGWQLFSLISMLIVLMSALAVAMQPELIDGLRSAIRATARTTPAQPTHRARTVPTPCRYAPVRTRHPAAAARLLACPRAPPSSPACVAPSTSSTAR